VPTAEPTPEPTRVPTPEPSEEPTPEPTEAPSEEPSEAPTPVPEATPCPTLPANGPGQVAVRDASAPSPGIVDSAAPARTPPAIALEEVASGLKAPVGITGAGDGSGRLFVIEQGGAIRIIVDGQVLDAPFLDVSDRIEAGGERGLLGIAFHPEYASNGRFFIYSTDLCGTNVVAEHRVSETDPNRAEQESFITLIAIDDPFPNHNGGSLAFGPDGYLYIGTGDGGSGGDPLNSGQRIDTLLGKLLRIDVDGRSPERPYGLPDNRLASEQGAEPEIFALGLRNPWRFSFDRETGDVWIGDVGQGAWEEINALPIDAMNGANFGWNVMEGAHCFQTPDCDMDGLVLPVAEYDQSAGDCAVTGGYVYRGPDPALQGWYVFSDYCSGTIRMLDPLAGAAPPVTAALETELSVASFGEGDDGTLYLVDLRGGLVLQVTAAE